MQKFLLIHDGSNQAWQTAYLAFHVSGSLGSPLIVLINNVLVDKNQQNFNANQVEIAGRAAGVVIQTIKTDMPITDFLTENTVKFDGLFIPRVLIPDNTVLRQYLTFGCPIWIVDQDAEHEEMAILIKDTSTKNSYLDYTIKLASRLQHNLTGLIPNSESTLSRLTGLDVNWYAMTDFSDKEIAIAIKRLDTKLLFIYEKDISIFENFSINFVIFPTS